MPALPGVSAFPELNVRTYVRRDGMPGVLFLSLDAASRLAVLAARLVYHLPYYHATMSVTPEGHGFRYMSRRTDPRGAPAELRVRYGPAGPLFRPDPGSLDYFLVERYCLYATTPGAGLYRADIHHAPWPLQPATAVFDANTMVEAAGLRLPPTGPVLHFAKRLDVVAGPPRREAT